MVNVSGSLSIGYDISGGERPILVVAKHIDGKTYIVKEFRDDEAVKLYELLTDTKTKIVSLVTKKVTRIQVTSLPQNFKFILAVGDYLFLDDSKMQVYWSVKDMISEDRSIALEYLCALGMGYRTLD